MLPAFKLGAGGRLGSGTQPFAWVHINDAVQALITCAENPNLTGAVNIVAPAEDSNQSLTTALGQVLSRPVIFPMPSFMARLMFGQMGEELLLNGRHVTPKKLTENGFKFQFKTIKTALKNVL